MHKKIRMENEAYSNVIVDLPRSWQTMPLPPRAELIIWVLGQLHPELILSVRCAGNHQALSRYLSC